MTLKSILIIDDDENVRQSLAMILRRSGYSVATANSAEVAMECLKNISFDLIFLDIQLPDMDGIDLLALIRKSYPNLCVVILSGTSFPSTGKELAPLRVSGNFIKPVDPALLLEFLDQALAF